MPKYVAGWNQPGYLPDTDQPLPEFDTFGDAIRYLADEVSLFWDEDYDGITVTDPAQVVGERLDIDAKWLDIHAELHNAILAHDLGTHEFAYTAGGFEWFVQPGRS